MRGCDAPARNRQSKRPLVKELFCCRLLFRLSNDYREKMQKSQNTLNDQPGNRPARIPVGQVDWSGLMARGQDGDAAAYIRLLKSITPFLRTLAAQRHRDPSDIEDAVQDILLAVHSIRHTYDPARPFGPWLVAIANRRLIDRLRQQGRKRARETPLTDEHDRVAAPCVNADGASVQHELNGAIDRLPLRQRQAILLLKLREMSLKEAALVSGMTVAALKVATHRALKSLEKILADRSST